MSSQAPRSVAVTGIGIVSSIGCGKEPFWRNVLDGNSVVEPIPSQWQQYATYRCPVWAPPPSINLDSSGLNRAEKMQMDPVQLYALICADMALKDAGFQLHVSDDRKNTYTVKGLPTHRAGVFIGSGNGGLVSYTQGAAHHLLHDAYLRAGQQDISNKDALNAIQNHLHYERRFNPFSVPRTMPNACSAVVSIKYGFNGPSVTVSSACASGTSAIGQAFRAIESGQVDFALAGGAEYLADPYGGIFRGFDVAKTLIQPSKDGTVRNCPFDEKRSGFLFNGGGAAILMLEDLEMALERGAHPLALIAGYAELCDAYTIMGMAPGGAQIQRMYNQLFTESNCAAEDIQYINSHGTGTLMNDSTEAAVIEQVFPQKPLINATKSLTGHSIGAAGAIEAAVTALSIERKKVHPNRNIENPIADIAVKIDKPEDLSIKNGISESFGFGGHIAGLLFREAVTP